MSKHKQTIILDFDGVINSYKSGWQGIQEINDPPVANVDKAIEKLREDFRVVVFSSRCHQKGGIEAIEDYLAKYDIKVDKVVRNKIPAVALIDDRGITFEGEWDDTFINKIKNFQPWHKK